MALDRRSFFLFTIMVTITCLLLKSYVWLIPNSANYEKAFNSNQDLDESSINFNAYLEFVQREIISRLQKIDKSSVNYFIYDCSSCIEGKCGGWNDRITGVINSLMLSIVLNKRFGLVMSKPCETKIYFIPSKINWTVKPEIMSCKNESKKRFTNARVFCLDIKNISSNFQPSVNLFRSNWDMVDVFRVTQNIREKIPWICNVHHADIYKIIFEALFKPSESLLRPISDLHLDKSKKLVCAHVRVGYNDKNESSTIPSENRFPIKNISMVFEFLKKFDPTTHYVYIASDSPKVKELSRETFYKNFIDIPGKITHVELDKGEDECEGFAKSLQEWWILTKCDVLVLTQSGFGVMAAYLRDNNKPLYCTNTGKLVPCSRYDAIEHYPLEMHIPHYIPISRRHDKTHDYCPPGELQRTEKMPWYLTGPLQKFTDCDPSLCNSVKNSGEKLSHA